MKLGPMNDCIPCLHVDTLLNLLVNVTCFFNWHTGVSTNHSSQLGGEESRFTVESNVSDAGPGHRQSSEVSELWLLALT